MPNLCTIFGILYKPTGELAVSATLRILRSRKGGVVLSSQTVSKVSDATTAAISFTAVRGSLTTLQGDFILGSYNLAAGVEFYIPDTATASLESLKSAIDTLDQLIGAVGYAPNDAKYIIQTADVDLASAQVLGALGTGMVKNTTTTGVLSIATASDLPLISTLTEDTSPDTANDFLLEYDASAVGHKKLKLSTLTTSIASSALLSTTHTDTTPAAVVRGDLIAGQGASPTWSRLALGASGTYPRSNGTDLAYSAIQAGDLPTGINAANIADGSVSSTEFQFLDGVTSAIQTQINAKVSFDINGLTEETAIANGDFVAIYDLSAGALRKMTKANFTTGLGGGSLTVREVDGSPSLTATVLEFQQAVGFVVTDETGGVARVTLSAVPDTALATISTAGKVSDSALSANVALRDAANVFSSATGQSVKKLLLPGSTSGTLTVQSAAVAGTNTLTLPAGTTDFSATGGASQVVKQTSAGGALTVAQLAASDLSNGVTGSGTVALATAPMIAGGAHTGLTSLGIRSTGTGAFDLTLANAENLTAGRALTIAVNDAARTLTVAGNATISGTNTGDGANAALSNLASVSINTALIPQTTVDLGAQATPFRDAWLYGSGTFGAHSFRLTGTPTAHQVLTLPNATDTLVGKATTDTFTNKTYDTAGSGNSFLINGLAATANTGTGSVVRATSPTLTTPAIGAATGSTLVLTASSANALTVGPNGTTNPTLNVVTNVASAATGLSITGNAAGSGVTLTALSSGSSEYIEMLSKGTAGVGINNQAFSPSAQLHIRQSDDRTITSSVYMQKIDKSGVLTNNTAPAFSYGMDISVTSTQAGSQDVDNVGANISVSGGSGRNIGLIINVSGNAPGLLGLGGVPAGQVVLHSQSSLVRQFLFNNSTIGVTTANGTYFSVGENGSFSLVNQETSANAYIRFLANDNTGAALVLQVGGSVAVEPTQQFGWLPGTTHTAAIDTGLARSGGAVVRTTNGSTGAGSLIVGPSTASIGTSGVGVLAMSSTAPTSSPADLSQLYAVDWNGAGTNAFHMRNEEQAIYKFGSAFVLQSLNAATNSVVDVEIIGMNSSGTAAAGFGGRQSYTLESTTTDNTLAAKMEWSWVVATHASRTARTQHFVYDTAAREYIRGEASGTAAMIGFLGSAAVAQQASAALTNNVTSGGTDNTIANYTDLTIYANDAAAIRNDIYQLARKTKEIGDALRLYGLLG